MKRKLLILTLPLLLFLTFATPVFAQGPDGGGRFVFGDNLTLHDEETVRSDVVIFGGNLKVPASATIEGDLALFGGNATIDGTVEGDIALIGGNANVGETAVLKGDMGLLGGNANVDEGATIEGEIVTMGGHSNYEGTVDRTPVPPVPPVPPGAGDFEGFSWVERGFKVVFDIVWGIVSLIALAVVSWLVATFMPQQMKQVGDTVAESAPLSFGVGLLTVVLSIVIGIPLLITICLLFIPILAWIIISIAVLLGWVVIGQIIGERLLVAIGQPYPNFAFSTIIGVIVLTLITQMPVIGAIPCIGFLLGLAGFVIGFIASLTGLGAVLLTRFGTRPYPVTPSYSSFGGGSAPRGSRPPRHTATEPEVDISDEDLGINSASEAELKAKIKAALAEADATAEAAPSEPEKPAETPEQPPEPTEEEPAPDQPDPDEPDKNKPQPPA